MKKMSFAALAALGVAACNGTTAPATSDYEPLPADQVMVGMDYNMSNGGIRSANLKADTALTFNDSTTIHLRKLDLEIFTEQGVVRALLTSKTGELDQNTNRMVARGTVVLVVKGENGRTIYTEELHYDQSQKQIWSDVRTEQVFPDGKRNVVDSFRSDDQFKNFRGTGLRGDAPGNFGF